MTLCSKPSCARPGAAVLSYDYGHSIAMIDDPADGELSPHVYVLCMTCAEKMRPPRGWELKDRRSRPPLFLDPMADAIVLSVPEPTTEAAESSRRQLFFGYSA